MLKLIVDKLNTDYPGVKAVAYMGYKSLPAPPYVVVKEGTGPVPARTYYTIIAHYPRGMIIDLKDYIRGDVGTSLEGFAGVNRHGNYNQLYYDENEMIQDPAPESDDGTISMFRTYYMPDKL